jgi:hypothetical protein
MILLSRLAQPTIGQVTRTPAERLQLLDSTKSTFTTSFPITRDSLNIYPDSAKITGTMVDYTLGMTCGYFCGCGTLKVKLQTKVAGYPFEHIYVAIPCFSELTKEISDKTEWSLYEIPMNDRRCYWTELPRNKFATFGVPFYVLEKDRMKQ